MMFDQRSNQRSNRSDSTMQRRGGETENRANDRMQRFQQFLETRGCPVRLNQRNTDPEIRWLG